MSGQPEAPAGHSGPGRALILSTQSVLVPRTGAELRNYHLARQLSGFLEVTCVCFRPVLETGTDSVAGLAGKPIAVVSVPRPPTYTFRLLLRGLVGRDPVSMLNYSSPAMAAALNKVLEQGPFEFVQIEGTQMAGYLPLLLGHAKRPRAVVFDWHNIESVLMRRYSRTAPGLARRLYALQTGAKLRAAELRLLRQPFAHLVVSELDRSTLLDREPGASVFVVENGVDAAYYSEAAKADGNRFRLLFVGAMDYHANVEAVGRFVRETWPAVQRAVPGLIFTVVGRDPGPGIRALRSVPNVEVTGTVPDVRPYYREAVAAVVPLRVVGGTRLKILESMAAGVPVVTTGPGVEGLRAREGVHYLLANSTEEFTETIRALNRRDGACRSLIASARELVSRSYDWSTVGASLRSAYATLSSAAPSPGGLPGFFDGRPKLRK